MPTSEPPTARIVASHWPAGPRRSASAPGAPLRAIAAIAISSVGMVAVERNSFRFLEAGFRIQPHKLTRLATTGNGIEVDFGRMSADCRLREAEVAAGQ